MNIESTKERLGEALGKIEKITSKNLTLPVLQCVLLTVTGKELTLRATNLDVGVEVTLPVKVTTEGVVAVPAGILSQYINNIPKEKVVTLKVVDQNLVIVTNQSSTTIKALAHDEFPLIPEAVGEEFTLPSLIIQEGLKSVWYSASTSSIKPELSSVYIYSGDKTIVFVATDSFRLAEKHFPIKEHKELPPFLLPLKNIPDVLKFLDGYTGEVTVSIAKNQITLVFPGHYLTSRVVEGTFPDYKQLIPKSKAPKLIRFPDKFSGFITRNVNKRAKGIVNAVIKAALTFPIRKMRMSTTRPAPVRRLCSTVPNVALTRSERS
jgi:DNA polymerase-3 subunit beta